jgi:transposase, IS5 family
MTVRTVTRNADAKHKLIRRYEVTDAAVHDSQKLEGLLNKGNTSAEVFGDSAYRSREIEAKLKASGFKSRIHRRARRNRPLSEAQTQANRKKSKIRASIEHVFGAQQIAPGGRIVRTIGIVRARAKIGLQNLAYNIRRFMTLERLAAASSAMAGIERWSQMVVDGGLHEGRIRSTCSEQGIGLKKQTALAENHV